MDQAERAPEVVRQRAKAPARASRGLKAPPRGMEPLARMNVRRLQRALGNSGFARLMTSTNRRP
ncbi:MAG TPA: hypothetical protein VNN10_12490, partial [Dehalococcoidia bacterium]|nr:hypothetical protein [Dehalococcoidia bacterium]